MASVNKVILLGNMGKEAEIRTTAQGDKVASFNLATSDTYKDKEGIRQTKTEWHNVVVFNKGLVSLIEQYTHKGSKLYLEGSLKTRKYTDKTGVERYTTEIVLTNYNGNIVLLDHKDGEQPVADEVPVNEDSEHIPF